MITNISDRERALQAEVDALRAAIQTAYGYLWCVNNEPGTPIALYPPEKAAYEARKVLRDLLTTEQRGQGINRVLPIVRGERCPVCNGDDAGMSCPRMDTGVPGCLRDARRSL